MPAFRVAGDGASLRGPGASDPEARPGQSPPSWRAPHGSVRPPRSLQRCDRGLGDPELRDSTLLSGGLSQRPSHADSISRRILGNNCSLPQGLSWNGNFSGRSQLTVWCVCKNSVSSAPLGRSGSRKMNDVLTATQEPGFVSPCLPSCRQEGLTVTVGPASAVSTREGRVRSHKHAVLVRRHGQTSCRP